jgi:hypothetical protein
LVDFLLGDSALLELFSRLDSVASASDVAASFFLEAVSSVVFLVLALGDEELLDLSVVGLVFVADDSLGELFVEGFEEALAEGFGEAAELLNGVGFGVTIAAAVPLALGAAEVDGAAVAATLALGAGAAGAFVEALELVTLEPPLV